MDQFYSSAFANSLKKKYIFLNQTNHVYVSYRSCRNNAEVSLGISS